MHINKLSISKYKMLENLEITFRVTSKNENIINVIAGKNGTGKTSILELIYKTFALKINNEKKVNFSILFDEKYTLICEEESDVLKIDSEDKKFYGVGDLENYYIKNNKNINEMDTSPKIIYLESDMNFKYYKKYELDKSYSFVNKIDSNDILGNAECFIENFILKSIVNDSIKSNPEDRIKEAIEKFNKVFLNTDFITKLVALDSNNNFKPIFENINGEKLTIDKLSGGEQQLYGRVISLMILNPQNSIILIDEPELGLHPEWQRNIMKIYQNIGENNQFIITTHSPHILADINYRNFTFLYREEKEIKIFQPKQPPIKGDVNTILKEFMDSDSIPAQLKDLRKKYRKHIENKTHETPEAKKTKEEILKYESEESDFMQSMKFYLEFGDMSEEDL